MVDSIQQVQDGIYNGLREHGGQLSGSIQETDLFFGTKIGIYDPEQRKRSIFRDITQCIPFKVNRRFGGTLSSSKLKIN
jgi:hypothetical protein